MTILRLEREKFSIRPHSPSLSLRELGFAATVPRVLPLLHAAELMAGGEETTTAAEAEMDRSTDRSLTE